MIDLRPWILLAAVVLLPACTSEPSPEPEPSRAAESLPPVSVLISHEVTDFDRWKAAFEAHAPARKEASCLGHYLKRGIDEPDTVWVYCLATDADRLRAFLDSPDLEQVMQDAGVIGQPTFTVMKPMSRDLVSGKKLPGIIVMHAVEDYATWRGEYDAFDDQRRSAGIIGHAVSQHLDDPNQLVVYHQADDVAALRAFVESEELRAGMERAGVVGQPEIHFIQVVDFADY